jgi:hypothetical protein
VSKKRLDLFATHRLRMAQVVKADVLAIPFDKTADGIWPIAARLQREAKAIEELGRVWAWRLRTDAKRGRIRSGFGDGMAHDDFRGVCEH